MKIKVNKTTINKQKAKIKLRKIAENNEYQIKKKNTRSLNLTKMQQSDIQRNLEPTKLSKAANVGNR